MPSSPSDLTERPLMASTTIIWREHREGLWHAYMRDPRHRRRYTSLCGVEHLTTGRGRTIARPPACWRCPACDEDEQDAFGSPLPLPATGDWRVMAEHPQVADPVVERDGKVFLAETELARQLGEDRRLISLWCGSGFISPAFREHRMRYYRETLVKEIERCRPNGHLPPRGSLIYTLRA